MVQDVMRATFEERLAVHKADADVSGEVYPDEIVLTVAAVPVGQQALSAFSVHASVDFDPLASSPKAEDLLRFCVDAVGDVFKAVIDQEPGLALSDLRGVPLEWDSVEISKRKVYLKVDRSNPKLDRMADDWLAKNDPKWKETEELEDSESSQKFVTGRPKGTPSGGQIH